MFLYGVVLPIIFHCCFYVKNHNFNFSLLIFTFTKIETVTKNMKYDKLDHMLKYQKISWTKTGYVAAQKLFKKTNCPNWRSHSPYRSPPRSTAYTGTCSLLLYLAIWCDKTQRWPGSLTGALCLPYIIAHGNTSGRDGALLTCSRLPLIKRVELVVHPWDGVRLVRVAALITAPAHKQ